MSASDAARSARRCESRRRTAAIGGRDLQKAQTNHMGDFMSMVDFPPAPKLDPMNRLRPELATAAELRGEALFTGKAMCAGCHPAAQHFTDNMQHDLQMERFYPGRPEGPIKKFSLRGIKDSPPHLHDGRLFTLEDTGLFFDLVLRLGLTEAEREDLVAYLRAVRAPGRTGPPRARASPPTRPCSAAPRRGVSTGSRASRRRWRRPGPPT